ncbi:hypothetical protein GCM10009575_029540 [Streptomyces rhizosphaericus]|uniref:Uncharacterized protein n=1 Tax=Streptomyces rhizosphaericus TaxID=114699 RepID=A0ABN1PH97_9ACTN
MGETARGRVVEDQPAGEGQTGACGETVGQLLRHQRVEAEVFERQRGIDPAGVLHDRRRLVAHRIEDGITLFGLGQPDQNSGEASVDLPRVQRRYHPGPVGLRDLPSGFGDRPFR